MNSKRLILLSISLLLLISAFSCGKKATEPGMERVSTPTFDPPGGTYSGDQEVSIRCATLGVTILYTTDGTEPHSGSSVYKDPIEIFKHTTIKAKAFRNGFKDSKTAKATYNVSVVTPTFSPEGGQYTSEQSVRITCATYGATIRYTTDGKEPTSSSTVYNSPINVDGHTMLKAKAFKDGWIESSTASASYSFKVGTPTFSPGGGTYYPAQNLTLTCSTLGATIHYTTDGSEPSSSSTIYSSPIYVSSNTTLKAKAFKDGWPASSTSSATYTIELLPMEMVLVPGGTFTMGRTAGSGDSDELPTHSVTLSSFYIGKYEVTQAEYANLMQPGSSWTQNYGLGDDYPAYYISWYAALKYCNLRSMAEGFTAVYSISGSTDPANWGAVPTSSNSTWDAVTCNWNANGYRLPTEAEWEYAARGATNTPDYLYSGSDDINEVAWYDGNSGGNTHPVGTKAPNGIGTYDMSGNLWEWCWDRYDSSYYYNSPQDNPKGPTSGSYRLLRGGGWLYDATYCRVAYRSYDYPYGSDLDNGFRLCRAIN